MTVEASDGLWVVVCDTGVGIAVERLPAILERFTPLDPACPIAPAGRVSAAAGDPSDGAARQPSTIESELRVGTAVRATFPNDRIVSRLFLNVDHVDS